MSKRMTSLGLGGLACLAAGLWGGYRLSRASRHGEWRALDRDLAKLAGVDRKFWMALLDEADPTIPVPVGGEVWIYHGSIKTIKSWPDKGTGSRRVPLHTTITPPHVVLRQPLSEAPEDADVTRGIVAVLLTQAHRWHCPRNGRRSLGVLGGNFTVQHLRLTETT